MLPKRLKLSVEEFPRKSTLCFRGGKLSLKKVFNGREYARFGIVVSKKISPKATARNWAKRQIYNFLGEHLGEIPRGIDLLVIVGGHIIETNSDTKNALYAELEKGIKAL